MCDSKLNCLRVIQSWLFCDGIIKINQSSVDLNDGPYTLKLRGDTIHDSHLNQILEKDRHNFFLQQQGYTIYNGKFKPVDMDMDGGGILDPLTFEQCLLYLSSEKNCCVILCRLGSALHAYFSTDQQESSEQLKRTAV